MHRQRSRVMQSMRHLHPCGSTDELLESLEVAAVPRGMAEMGEGEREAALLPVNWGVPRERPAPAEGAGAARTHRAGDFPGRPAARITIGCHV